MDRLKQAAIDVVRTLRQAGHQAYLVGGCVRDLLLGREPADYDVATDAKPEEVMAIFPQTWAVGAQFGVVLVPVDGGRVGAGLGPAQDGSQTRHTFAQSQAAKGADVPHNAVIEVATFRSDGLYTDGRHPDEVQYTKKPEEDVRRRDFTINGLLLDPLNNEVLDFV